jgi:phenylalanyl-tRNA synthetase alpha chain
MLEKLDEIKETSLGDLGGARTEDELEDWRVRHLGRKSPIMEVFAGLGALSPEERPAVGRKANEIRTELEDALAERLQTVHAAGLLESLRREQLDVTLPGRPLPRGRLHPVTQTMRRIYAIFAEMGFQIYRSRDVETDEMNFQLLNFPLHHPAREMQDSFYLGGGTGDPDNPVLLRTHTSPGQIRSMRENSGYGGEGPLPADPPPIRIILPGMCYRYEQITTRANVQFTQVEGLAVGKRITFGDLKGTLSDFARRMFGQQVRTRFRASHFPFTEPSAEMDVECFVCGGEGCSVCKHAGWLEILGSGMVHPVVLHNGGYDPAIYSGFAFGMGPERITMLRHRIDDIRYFWDNDMRFLEQF